MYLCQSMEVKSKRNEGRGMEESKFMRKRLEWMSRFQITFLRIFSISSQTLSPFLKNSIQLPSFLSPFSFLTSYSHLSQFNLVFCIQQKLSEQTY